MNIKTVGFNFKYVTFRPQVRTLNFINTFECNNRIYGNKAYSLKFPWQVFFLRPNCQRYPADFVGFGLTAKEFTPGSKVHHCGLPHVRGDVLDQDFYSFAVCSNKVKFEAIITDFWFSSFDMNYTTYNDRGYIPYEQHLAKMLDSGEVPLLEETPVYWPGPTGKARVLP